LSLTPTLLLEITALYISNYFTTVYSVRHFTQTQYRCWGSLYMSIPLWTIYTDRGFKTLY